MVFRSPIPSDIGANFIHGTDQNPLSDIASKVKSTFVSSLSLRRCFDGDGHAVDAETAGLIFAKTWEYSAAASDHSRWNDVDKNQSVDDFFRQRLREDKDLKDEKTKYFVGTGLELHSSITACDLDKLSLKYYWMEDDLPVWHLMNMLMYREIDHSWIQLTIPSSSTSLNQHCRKASLSSTQKYVRSTLIPHRINRSL